MVQRFYKKSRIKKTSDHKPFHLFIIGGGGSGKSHLIKATHMSLSKVLIYKGGDPEKPRILLLAPTGVAAVHIKGQQFIVGLK